MKKVAVIYWSGTGNTELMAQAVADGAKEAGAEVSLLSVDQASVENVTGADGIALGCPSMGAEELEPGEMEPFVESLEGKVNGKPTILFGSYDWGNGEWMQDWGTRMENYGSRLVKDGYTAHLTPGAEELAALKALGAALVAAI